ncbi:cobalamin B12-binding domain-containing protein [Haloarchaeobius amylolyticus]|uniref:Cobalamin B12-binding domain-containing protein n=1 Tax=Haloarchaeobius amylolyticus TaxID=1198296 RepID=A0ABD6BB69_9EURY
MSTENDERTIRCMVAKVGLDGHDRGAHVISRAFRDAGFEVIYSGLHKAPDDIVQAAVQEDIDVLGISILSGAHNTLVPKIMDGLEEYGAKDDTLVLVGGVIPEEDRDDLKEAGAAAIFGPGTSIEETIEFVRENVPDR